MNRKSGERFEREFCEILSDHDFWVHWIAQRQAGQPADVLAVKKGKAYLIDCKVCANSERGFVTSRIEENQALAMDLWEELENGLAWFALKFEETGMVYMVPYIRFKLDDKRKYSEKDIWDLIRQRKSKLLSDWVQEYGS